MQIGNYIRERMITMNDFSNINMRTCPECHSPFITMGVVEDEVCPACAARKVFDAQMEDWMRRKGYVGIRKVDGTWNYYYTQPTQPETSKDDFGKLLDETMSERFGSRDNIANIKTKLLDDFNSEDDEDTVDDLMMP
jgi:hypothetical protein